MTSVMKGILFAEWFSGFLVFLVTGLVVCVEGSPLPRCCFSPRRESGLPTLASSGTKWESALGLARPSSLRKISSARVLS